ncbi:MAG: permease [Hydrogenophaga sp.]|uniref:esterase/lipase family protein n=1 Tax=Hydrogenophaga sp. TaxID=1904254 RepID=UPI0016B23071|nr:alpha/beta fold hydrolase [Hydrogenophaga sp.]NIU62381.1 permease [Stutzerimonas stutzeri]NIM41487.1 permease [Hydrogenophaga sp.]NIN26795.1 permease [Hydrogenophaga sp.]NIN31496.1 permease [Hydrogenophaga sp.]NIN55729.1 permease [Hydrogenophaga sp.]
MLADLQRMLVIGGVLALLGAAVLWGKGHPVAALLVAIVVLFGYAGALGLEFALAAWVNRREAAATTTLGAWWRAWWREVRVAPQVFAWRQPFRWQALPDSEAPLKGAAVVLVHGFVCNRGFWLPWLRALRERGTAYATVNLEPVFGSIDAYVPQVEAAIRRAERLGDEKPVLVCHSMGGLAARAWLAADPRNAERVQWLITIGSPHRGTWIGRFSRVANGRQMRVDCDWLCQLAVREREQRGDSPYAQFVCWYADTDNIVFPASTATLPGADNRLVPGAAHVDLAFHPKVMGESLAMLASAGSSPSERTDP